MAEPPVVVIPLGGTIYLDPFSQITAIKFRKRELIIEGGTDVNVYDAAVAAGFNVDNSLNLKVRVTGDVKHLIWDNRWAAGSTFKLTNEAYIVGHGGIGGNGPYQTPTLVVPGTAGTAGGPAIELYGNDVEIDNGSGFIFGGGGGGGGGASTINGIGPGDGYTNGGGGGGGAGDGTGGNAEDVQSGVLTDGWGVISEAQDGSSEDGPFSGQVGADGGAGTHNENGSFTIYGGDGGKGGGWGEAGASGGTGSGNSLPQENEPQTAGGAAGKAIDRAGGSVTWIAGNTPERVKGAVS